MVYLVLIVSSVIISSLSAVSLCTPENSAIQKLSIIIIIITNPVLSGLILSCFVWSGLVVKRGDGKTVWGLAHLGLKQVQVVGVYIISENQMYVSVSPSLLKKEKLIKKNEITSAKVSIVNAFNFHLPVHLSCILFFFLFFCCCCTSCIQKKQFALDKG